MAESPDLLTVPEAAELLHVDVARVRQHLRDGVLLAERGADGVLRIPAMFVAGGVVVKGLPGTITLLRDSGFDDSAALRWLFTSDPTLPGNPAEALAQNRGTEVKRRAQALAL